MLDTMALITGWGSQQEQQEKRTFELGLSDEGANHGMVLGGWAGSQGVAMHLKSEGRSGSPGLSLTGLPVHFPAGGCLPRLSICLSPSSFRGLRTTPPHQELFSSLAWCSGTLSLGQLIPLFPLSKLFNMGSMLLVLPTLSLEFPSRESPPETPP